MFHNKLLFKLSVNNKEINCDGLYGTALFLKGFLTAQVSLPVCSIYRNSRDRSNT